MEKNIGIIDRIGRIILVLLVLFVAHRRGKLLTVAGLSLFVSGALLHSVMNANCPLYTILGINTSK